MDSREFVKLVRELKKLGACKVVADGYECVLHPSAVAVVAAKEPRKAPEQPRHEQPLTPEEARLAHYRAELGEA